MLFPWYIKYPNQNDEILNLDWILSTIDNLVNEVANFVSLNSIKYADPIQWNITTQYEKNTVVIDPITGTAYISTKPVPSGIGLNNTDYWTVVFTLDVISANKNITLRDDANNILATFESAVGDWLLWQGTLYKVSRAIDIGQSYVEGYNLERFTVENFIKQYIEETVEYIDNAITTVNTAIGDLDNLTTTDKANLVAAVNELVSSISTLGTNIANVTGDLSNLTTTDKANLVAAINELVSAISTLRTNVAAVTGDLTNLTTTDKSNLVAAINELQSKINNGLRKRKYLIIGDSYSLTYYPDTQTYGQGWTGKLQSLLLNMDDCESAIIKDQSGAGFNNTNSFATLISAWISELGAAFADITDIIICCGRNDFGISYSVILANMLAFKNNIRAVNAKCNIFVGMVGNDTNITEITVGKYYHRYETFNNYVRACNEIGVNYLSGVENILRNSDLMRSDDGKHPNYDGGQLLGAGVFNALTQGYASVCYPLHSVSFTGLNGITVTGQIREVLNNNCITLSNDSVISFIKASGFTLNGNPWGTEIDLANGDFKYFKGLGYLMTSVPIQFYANRYGGGYVSGVGCLVLYGDKITLRITQINATGDGFENYNLVELNLSPINYVSVY